jgi:hypothetical protein
VLGEAVIDEHPSVRLAVLAHIGQDFLSRLSALLGGCDIGHRREDEPNRIGAIAHPGKRRLDVLDLNHEGLIGQCEQQRKAL